MIELLAPMLDQHTQRLASLLYLQRKAAETLANIMADIGAALIQIQEEIKAADLLWSDWVQDLNAALAEKGFDPLSTTTLRRYMSIGEFRKRAGARFAAFMDLDPSCLYPVATLTIEQITDMADHGVPAADGRRIPLPQATSREMEWAAGDYRGHHRPAPAPTRADELRRVLADLKKLGPLSDDEAAPFVEALALEEAPIAEPTVQRWPVVHPPVAVAPASPQPVIGGLTLRPGVTLTMPTRADLADKTLTMIQNATAAARRVELGQGTLPRGHKSSALTACEELRLAILKYPAFS